MNLAEEAQLAALARALRAGAEITAARATQHGAAEHGAAEHGAAEHGAAGFVVDGAVDADAIGTGHSDDVDCEDLARFGLRVAAVLRDAESRHAVEHAAADRVRARTMARLNLRAGVAAPRHPTTLELLRRSPLLRIAAASLLVHLLALPVLAWFAFRPPDRAPLVVRFLPPDEGPADFAEAPQASPVGRARLWELEQRQRLERHALFQISAHLRAGNLLPDARERAEAAQRADWSLALVAGLDVWAANDGASAQRVLSEVPVAALDSDPVARALLLGAEFDAALRVGTPAGLSALAPQLAALESSTARTHLGDHLLGRARALGLLQDRPGAAAIGPAGSFDGGAPELPPPTAPIAIDTVFELLRVDLRFYGDENAGPRTFGPLERWQSARG